MRARSWSCRMVQRAQTLRSAARGQVVGRAELTLVSRQCRTGTIDEATGFSSNTLGEGIVRARAQLRMVRSQEGTWVTQPRATDLHIRDRRFGQGPSHDFPLTFSVSRSPFPQLSKPQHHASRTGNFESKIAMRTGS